MPNLDKPLILPDRLPIRMPQGRNLPVNYAQAWNDALDEVIRLNKLTTDYSTEKDS